MASFLYTLICAGLIASILLIFRHKDETFIQNLSRWKALFVSYLIGFPIITVTLNNDFWFIQPIGHIINTKGFVTTEPLSMHSGLSYVCQQWGFASIIDFIYSFSGILGCMIFAVLLSYVLEYVIYRICLLLSKSRTKSLIITALFITVTVGQLTTRPYLITAILLGLEILFLELYIYKNNRKYLLLLPVLSLISINIQCSMWMIQFVFMIPYLTDAIRFPHKEKYVIQDDISISYLILTCVTMFLAGFINPYGLQAITYIFNSYGVNEINNFINEMKPFSLKSIVSIYSLYFLFLILIIFLIYYKCKKSHIVTVKMRYILLILGTILLTFLNLRSQILFVVAAPAGVAYAWGLNRKRERVKNNNIEKLVKMICCAIILAGGIVINSSNWLISCNPEKNNELYKIVNYLDENYDRNVKIFATYDDGGYLEYRGYKPYIDARAEVFLKSNNKKYNYFIEFYDLCIGDLNYDIFFKQYNFDVIIVGNNLVLNNQLENDDNYIKICTSQHKTKNLYVHKSKIKKNMIPLEKSPLDLKYD